MKQNGYYPYHNGGPEKMLSFSLIFSRIYQASYAKKQTSEAYRHKIEYAIRATNQHYNRQGQTYTNGFVFSFHALLLQTICRFLLFYGNHARIRYTSIYRSFCFVRSIQASQAIIFKHRHSAFGAYHHLSNLFHKNKYVYIRFSSVTALIFHMRKKPIP